VLDTDLIARQVVAPGSPGLEQIEAAFGREILSQDGGLDRARLRALVFADPGARKTLEAITHPLIRQELARQAAAAVGDYQIHVIPLLVESGLEGQVDRVLLVDCPEATQLERLRKRDGETDRSARQMLAAQASREARLASADDVVVNDGSRSELAGSVASLDRFYRRLAADGDYEAPGRRLP
jgi:dephospho-CoA kinase